MDWLNWTVRAFTVIGGLVALVCIIAGAATIITSVRASLEIWAAKRRFYKLQKESPEFQAFLMHFDPKTKDTDENQQSTPPLKS